jgi:PBP1b-binding outer membrane lipoprotein LpoB
MVRQQINNLSENVAPSPDKLVSKVLKTNCDQILEPLTKMLQTSFLSGRLSKLWRQVIVTPIFKKVTNSMSVTIAPLA